jgi:sirohydrochlorin cobaltochelatase
MNQAILLIGHGSPAADTPRELIRELKKFEEERNREKRTTMSQAEKELDEKIRRWPRNANTDPYQKGLEAIGSSLKKRMPEWNVALAYNEFCAPSITEKVEALVGEGHRKIVFLTTMLTRGGIHAECEIPWEMKLLQDKYPEVKFSYTWPFNTDSVAEFLAGEAERHLST